MAIIEGYYLKKKLLWVPNREILNDDTGLVSVIQYIIQQIIWVVKHPYFYYVFATINGLNLPWFAAFCLFCDKFNNLRAKYIVGKLRQIGAEHGILGGFSFMIKVLFICHGKSLGKYA